MASVRKVAIVASDRIPFCRSNTAYSDQTNQGMLTQTLKNLVEKTSLHGERLGEVAGGAIIKHARDFNLVRESVLSSGLAPETPAYDVQQACGTSVETAILVANKIALGQIDAGIACGVDNTSDAPIVLGDKLRKTLLKINNAKTGADRLKLLADIRPKHLIPEPPRNGEPRTRKSMGQHCEMMAKTWNIQRADQDQLAFESHQKLAAAYDSGFMDDLVSPYNGVERDNVLRPDTSLEKLASLKPAFDKKSGKGTLTAANSTNLTDGAAAVLLASEEWAKEKGLPILAYFVDGETSAIDFETGKEGLLMAPVYAVPRLLERNGLSLQDFDYYEIHEAFAAQVLCTLAAWEDTAYCKKNLGLKKALGKIDRNKLNVKGSSLAAGHPFAATGARIVGNLAKILDEAGSGRGLISVCAAGGMGVTAIIEK